MERRKPQPPAVRAVAVVVQLEEGGAVGRPLLALELLAEATVGLLRVEHVQDVPPQSGEGPGVVAARQVEQRRLRPAGHGGFGGDDLGGQRSQ